MLTELMPLLKGEKKTGYRGTPIPDGTGAWKRKVDQKTWEMGAPRPTHHSQHLHPERGSKHGPKNCIWLFL